uniref:CHK kinase-like domain-containing protein n=1 Tax=Minutocellus polymorphus TaxID=265543 RepID=A0A7S0FJC7_9STRA|mmetsp:Transcript_15042/g.25070  ORF Transcript_15042/g.25070 Transcript_15042/m.25070 type:complete len:427 (+) Transcript_15042:146-1426(+)|eukprot:CAMPEP_0197726598 /NCGR_PEP_ID=MMETSP1434-20131217/16348_1 /TAXON_ID=265543 /ORGANISM="Minutocellus polymorphus, Strain CCMP3303" /LENGTH=426 /DNA_ID=CAMNT_0043312581 /DNA_START=72 /DNA_END=1352 /DNA_ORIENTATION=+
MKPSHKERKSNKNNSTTAQGISAVLAAMRNVAEDECRRSTHDIPINAVQLESYLSTKLGGDNWSVSKADTAGVTSEYYRGICATSGQRVFVKLAKPTKGGRIQDAGLLTGASEVEFYNRLTSALDKTSTSMLGDKVHMPTSMVAESSRHRSRYVVVLEDLSPTNGANNGDNEEEKQENSKHIRFIQPVQALPTSDVKLILRALAAIHGKYWEDEDAIPSIYQKRTNRASKLVGLIIGKTIKQFRTKGGLIEPRSDTDRIIAATQRLGGIFAMDALLDALHPDLRTLVHGDCHGANIFMVEDENSNQEVGLLDWQTYFYGNPLADVASVLIMCLSAEDFAEHREVLMKYYLDALCECGIDINVTTDMLHEAVCCRTAYYLSGTLLGIAFVGMDDPERQGMLDRGWAMISRKASMLDLATFLEARLPE